MATEGRARPPSVERVLTILRSRGETAADADVLTAATRSVLADERRRLEGGEPPAAIEVLADAVEARLSDAARIPPFRAINATGVIIHTNLGRAPWPEEAIAAAREAAGSLLLELDPSTGRRGSRLRLAEEHLIALTGGEDAVVTNNNAAALALAVGLAGRGRGIAVSRGELVEIGGGVRIPEIVRRAGSRLIEVGTTNRTRASDYEEPLAAGRARVVLRVHPSNFSQLGFTESPDAEAVAALAHRNGSLVIDDLGSGALLPTERFGLAHEPTPRERLAAGADLVTFSGDKLVGGPQAGFIVGRANLIARLRRDPLARAMRPDKVTLAAVAATLALYRAGRAVDRIPVWRMIAATVDDLRTRATALAGEIGAAASVIECVSTVGGGSLPGETLPSIAVAIGRDAAPGRSVDRLLAALRVDVPPIIGRIEGGLAVFDIRTVDPSLDDRFVAGLRAVLGRRDGADKAPRRVARAAGPRTGRKVGPAQ